MPGEPAKGEKGDSCSVEPFSPNVGNVERSLDVVVAFEGVVEVEVEVEVKEVEEVEEVEAVVEVIEM